MLFGIALFGRALEQFSKFLEKPEHANAPNVLDGQSRWKVNQTRWSEALMSDDASTIFRPIAKMTGAPYFSKQFVRNITSQQYYHPGI